MLRTIGSVIVGYVAMAVVVFLTFTLAYLAMGTNNAFQPGTYEVTTLWLMTSFVLAFIAALVGGYICAMIAKNPKAPIALAGLVVVLGVLLAVPVLMQADSGAQPVRGPEVANLDAMQNAKQPAWVALLNPFLGATGILLGGRLKKSRED